MLMTGTAKLEQVIAARRNEQDIPSINAVVASLAALSAEAESTASASGKETQTEDLAGQRHTRPQKVSTLSI